MRWLIRSIGALISLVVLVAAGVFLIPAERLAQLAATQIEMATGRAVEIDGGVRPMLWPAPGVATGPVRIANADWAGEAPMLAAQGMQLRLDLAEALRGRLSVERIAIERTLQACGGNKAQAADVLGIALRTIYRKLKDGSE